MGKYELIKTALYSSEKLQSFYNIKVCEKSPRNSNSKDPKSISSSLIIPNNYKNINSSDNLIDYSVISEMARNIGNDKMKTILILLISELSEKLHTLRNILEYQSFEKLKKKALMLNGVCNTFGAMPLAKLFKKIELLAVQNNNQVFSLIPEAEKLIHNTLNEIQNISFKNELYII